MAVVVKTVGVGEFTTHFRTYLSGWIGMFSGSTGFSPMDAWGGASLFVRWKTTKLFVFGFPGGLP